MDRKIYGAITFVLAALPISILFLVRQGVKTEIEGGDGTLYFSLIEIVAPIGVYLLLILVFALGVAMLLKPIWQLSL